MKRTLWFSILAAAALMPLAAMSQVAPEAQSGPPAPPAASPKYEVIVGYGYSTLNQVNESRYGLQGVEVTISRNFGRFFALTALGDKYRWATSKGSGEGGNPGDPTINSVLIGPEVRAPLYGPVSGFFRGLMGGENTDGESETPTVSFAGGVGGGLQYDLNKHLAVRLSGDRIGASFSLINNSTQNAYSPHRTWNTRASIGVAYRF